MLEETILRSLERILVVSGAIISIVLGYRLFRDIPFDRDANGKISLPGGIEVTLAKIGPGAFFALFGAVVLGMSLSSQVSVKQTATATTAVHTNPAASPTVSNSQSYTGVGASAALDLEDQLNRQSARTRLLPYIAFLNSLQTEYPGKPLSAEEQASLARRIRDTKLALLEPHWDQSLGDWREFRDWLYDQNHDAIPPGHLQQAVALFRHGGSR